MGSGEATDLYGGDVLAIGGGFRGMCPSRSWDATVVVVAPPFPDVCVISSSVDKAGVRRAGCGLNGGDGRVVVLWCLALARAAAGAKK